MEKASVNAEKIGKIVGFVVAGLVLAYLGFARTSSKAPERYTPTVDGDCIHRLTVATNGKITTEELGRRCTR